MAVAFRSASPIVRLVTTPAFTTALPAGVADGDFLLTIVSIDTTALSWTGTPLGWARVAADVSSSNDGQIMSVWWKTASSEPSTYSWNSGDNAKTEAVVLAYSGANGLSGTPSSTSNSSANASPVSIAASGITVVDNGSLLLWVAGGDPDLNVTGSWTAPASPGTWNLDFSDYTQGAPSTDSTCPIACASAPVNSGATGNVTGTMTPTGGAVSGWMAYLLAIKAAGAAAAQPGQPWQLQGAMGVQLAS